MSSWLKKGRGACILRQASPLFHTFSPRLHPSAPLCLFSLLLSASSLSCRGSALLYRRSLPPSLALPPSPLPPRCYFLICSHNIHLFSADSFSIYLNVLPSSHPQPLRCLSSSAAALPAFCLSPVFASHAPDRCCCTTCNQSHGMFGTVLL